jgi:prevent-host-death family protein
MPSWLDIAMRTVKIAELKDRLSEHLRAVEQGAEFTVTDRNRPIARIVPTVATGPNVRVSPPKVPFSSVRSARHKPAKWAVNSSQLLEEERRDR